MNGTIENANDSADHWSRDWDLVSRICDEYKSLVGQFGLAKRAQNKTLARHFSWLVENCNTSVSFLTQLLEDGSFRRHVETVLANLPKDVTNRAFKDADDVIGDMCFRVFYKVIRNSCNYKELRNQGKAHWGSFLWSGKTEIDLGNCTPFETEVFRCVSEKQIHLGEAELVSYDSHSLFEELGRYITTFPGSSRNVRDALNEDLLSLTDVDYETLVNSHELTTEEYMRERRRFFTWVRQQVKGGAQHEI